MVREQRVRLADVLHETATLFEPAEFPPQTKAALIFSIDGVEESEDIILHQGISKDTKLVSFSYLDSK